MSAYGTKLAEGFSQKISLELYDIDLVSVIVNRDYEGEINAVGSKHNILNFDRLSEKTYTGSALSADSLTENNAQLIIDQYKSFYWKEKTLDKWLSYIKNPHATIVQQVANERAKNIDTFALGFWGDVGAGNRVGTDYTAGDCEVAADGTVTGNGTTFTSAMVGRPFKATGHTDWYRVKTFSSTTEIVIEDDLDDVDSAYTGGVIASGTSYTIQAATPVTVNYGAILGKIAELKKVLDSTEALGKNAVPDMDRVLVVPPDFEEVLVRGTGVALHVPEVFSSLVQRGFIGMLQGFKVFKSNRLAGDNTNGWRVLAMHPMWLTFAEKVLDARMEEDLIGDFGTAYKDLFVYGGKVIDSRRHMAAELYCTFSAS